MAAKLQCEICGGKLIGKPGGIFECENCGTEYSTAWAKAKIQEITGTVKVEGTVEVTGKVQVDSRASKEALLRRGKLALEDADWNKASELFDQVLDLDPREADAYLGLVMAEYKCRDREEFQAKYTEPDSPIPENRYVSRVRQFADQDLILWFDKLDYSAMKAQERTQAKIQELRGKCQYKLAAGNYHTVGLKSDGTVNAAGWNNIGQCNVSGLTDIVAVAAGVCHTVGLRADGTVVTAPKGKYRPGVDWTNIIAIADGNNRIAGLKADGKVIIADSDFKEVHYLNWTNIAAIAGRDHFVGLRADGTVVAEGDNKSGECNTSDWTDIIAITAGCGYTVGLRSNKTVVAIGINDNGRCNVSEWTDIAAVAAGYSHTVGLKTDGTVVAVGDNNYGQCNVSGWSDILAVAAGAEHTVGLRADGTVIATTYLRNEYYDGQCDVDTWKLFENYKSIIDEQRAAAQRAEAMKEKAEAERKAAEEKTEAERKARIESLLKERDALNSELLNIKGMFAGSKKARVEAHLAEINSRLKRLE